ncbi:MAG: Gfo/Idh/MocA family oxidoreductase [Victivallaceae bacterium]|nr:Gfo/Idh/MocA family oxidoreductase [Victivallaceae bacterium]
MKKLRLGVIGACGRGALSDWAHRPEDGVEVVAGSDPYQLQREGFVKRHQEKFKHTPKTYEDYREMIEKEHLDGVFVTAPDFLHEKIACHCLEHKVPVYLEKPIAIGIESADKILRAAKDNNTRLMLGHNMRYMAFTNKMRDIIESGTIGEVKAVWCRHFVSYGGDAYFRDWHADRANTGSLLLQKGAHDIDIIHWLAGSRTVRVTGIGCLSVYDKVPRRKKGEEHLFKKELDIQSFWKTEQWPPCNLSGYYPVVNNEDINMISMQLANGVQACYLQCHFTPDCCRNYTVIGTRGRIENFGDGEDGTTVEVWTRRTDSFRREGDITFRMPPPGKGHGGADPVIISNFIDVLRGKAVPVSTPQGARYAVAAGILGAESIRNGSVPFDIPDLDADIENYDFSKNAKKLAK